MRSVNFKKSNKKNSSWVLATLLMKEYLDSRGKSNDLFDSLSPTVDQLQLNHCKFLFYGALRNIMRIEDALSGFIQKKPKNLLLAIFQICGYELLDSSKSKKEKIIHNAVEQAKLIVSTNEVKFINAVLRKLTAALDDQTPEKSFSVFYSHPQWLVEHWNNQFGKKNTEHLLSWNQKIPRLYLYSKSLPNEIKKQLNVVAPYLFELPEKGLQDTQIKEILDQGNGYIKDPATLNAVNALDPKPNESILDLCASPGGKTFDCIQRMENKGTIVAVDLPNKRMDRLKSNLRPLQKDNHNLIILPQDILKIDEKNFEDLSLPIKYDGILLDVPCSNTGVIQRKPDIRWRLNPENIKECAELQLRLLNKASDWIKPEGRIVYSTCSIDNAENDAVIDEFLKTSKGRTFKLIQKKVYYPWESEHDGAGVFLLKKSNI